MKNQKKNSEKKNLKTFEVLIIEVSSRIVKIEAENSDEALNQVIDLYDNQEIILDYTDFDDVEFRVLNKNIS